jgi:hypothetical protein
MISIDLCQFYGTDSEKELMTAIDGLRKIGMSDSNIQVILDRSKVGRVKEDEAKARWICCPMCDKARCERGADDCDVKRYLKNKAESEGER